MVTLVEQDRRTAVADQRTTPATLGFAKANVVAAPVGGTLARPPAAPYDVAFLDPPYPHEDDAVGTRPALAGRPRLAGPGRDGRRRAVRAQPRTPAWPDGFTDIRDKRYGETMLWYGHAASLPSQATPSEE